MIIKINIDQAQALAGIEFITDEGLTVTWPDLPDSDQESVINSMVGFVDLLGKDYVNRHMPLDEDTKEEPSSEESEES